MEVLIMSEIVIGSFFWPRCWIIILVLLGILCSAASVIAAESEYNTPSGSHASGITSSPRVELSITGPYDAESITQFTIRPGEILTQTYSVKNVGSSATGPFSLKFYLGVNKDTYLGEVQVSSLSPSQSKSGQASFAIPSDTLDGEYAAYLEAVKDGKVIKYPCASVRPIFVQRTSGNKPDLIPMALTVSKPAASGQPLTLTCTVKNKGSASSGPCQIAFYLSREKTLPSGTPVFATGPVGSLSIGETLKVSGTAAAPASAWSEWYYPIAQVDSSNQVAETAENNNLIVGEGFDIEPGGGANLMPLITSATVSSDKKALSVAYSVRNTGQASSSGGTLTFSLIYVDSGVQAASFDPIQLPSIQANGIHSATVTYTPVVETGDYYVRGTVELSSDTNQGDNTFTTQKTVHIEGSGPLPELSTVISKVPSSAKAGETISLQNIVYNTGSADARDILVGVYLSRDKQISSSDTLIGSHRYSDIFHENYAYETVRVTIPSGTSSGTWYLCAIVDPENTIPEKDEGNNPSDSATIQITGSPEKLVASFDTDLLSGDAPLTVTFTDTSTGSPSSWSWDFGDGSSGSSAKNPSHTFEREGTYLVTLTVTWEGGETDSATRTITVSAGEDELTAAFSYDTTLDPMTIQFSDQSSGDIQSYLWSFGDGGDSVERNPSHRFRNAGTYTVTLTVNSRFSSDSVRKEVVIGETGGELTVDFEYYPQSGSAPLSVIANATVTGVEPFQYLWVWGDNRPEPTLQTGSTPNVGHLYEKPGTYSLNLKVTDATGNIGTASHDVTVLSEYSYSSGDVSLSISGPDSVKPRDTITISCTATYSGSVSTPPHLYTRFYLSPDPSIDPGSDILIGDSNAGNWYGIQFSPSERSVSYEAPVLIGIDYLGEYYIGACLADWATGEPVPGGCDSYKVIIGPYEKREKDVDYTISLKFKGSSPGSIKPGRSYDFDTVLSNRGTESEHLVLTRYYLSTDAAYQAGQDTELKVGWRPLFYAEAKSSIGWDVDLALPESIQPGSYYILAYVNQDHDVFETDYSNNIAALPITVGASSQAAPPPPSPTKTPEPVQANEGAERYIATNEDEYPETDSKGRDTITFTISEDNSVSGTWRWEYQDRYAGKCTGGGTFTGTYTPSSGSLVMKCEDPKFHCSKTDGPAIMSFRVELTRSGESFIGTGTSIWKGGHTNSIDLRAVRA